MTIVSLKECEKQENDNAGVNRLQKKFFFCLKAGVKRIKDSPIYNVCMNVLLNIFEKWTEHEVKKSFEI